MWNDYFKLIRLKPGRVITHLCGEVDFGRENLPLETVRKLYESDFPYLEITELGERELYGIEKKSEGPYIEKVRMKSAKKKRDHV